MTGDRTDDLAAALGSRICHDLISPLGAIGNGVELLMMSGEGHGPEIALIEESVANANARIRFFRIAYGLAGPGQSVARGEIRSILDDLTRGGRFAVDWQVAGDAARTDVKLAFLALQCMETALPHGGRVSVAASGAWRIEGRSERLRLDPALWARLEGGEAAGEIAAAHVQFALLPREAARSGRRLRVETGGDRAAISY